MDCTAKVGMLRMCYSDTTDSATLNLTAAAGFTGNTLTVTKDTGELISCGYKGAATINQDTGTVIVHRTDANPVGEVRIVRSSGNPASYYNLSGGTLNADIIRGGFTGTNYGLNDTGGTIITRNIYRLGYYDGAVMNWTQGGSTLSPGGSIGNTDIGQSGYETKWITIASSKVQIELESAASFDTIHGSSNADLTLGILDVVALGIYEPTVNSFFDVIKLDLKTGKSGTGTFDAITDNLPGYFTAAWVDGAGTSDVLRITYVPEPATIALLGLGGLIAVRRRKK
jgi:hypothetical protein